MKLYEIDEQIEQLINRETGEIEDFEAFQNLQMEREQKIENIALWIKNLDAEASAVNTEKQKLAERETVLKNKVKRLKEYLSVILAGDKFTTARVAVNYRKSTAVTVKDGFLEWAKANAQQFVKAKYDVDKTAIKDALNSGQAVEGAELVYKQNIQIK